MDFQSMFYKSQVNNHYQKEKVVGLVFIMSINDCQPIRGIFKLSIRNLPQGGSEVYFRIPKSHHLERKAIL